MSSAVRKNDVNVKFDKPAAQFSDTDAETIGALVARSCDIALVTDAEGLIQDVSGTERFLANAPVVEWVGQTLTDVLQTPSDAEKLINLATQAPDAGRECILDVSPGNETFLKIKFTAVRVETSGQLVFLGQDITNVMAMQQRILPMSLNRWLISYLCKFLSSPKAARTIRKKINEELQSGKFLVSNNAYKITMRIHAT